MVEEVFHQVNAEHQLSKSYQIKKKLTLGKIHDCCLLFNVKKKKQENNCLIKKTNKIAQFSWLYKNLYIVAIRKVS